jgi:hypothetical protein
VQVRRDSHIFMGELIRYERHYEIWYIGVNTTSPINEI